MHGLCASSFAPLTKEVDAEANAQVHSHRRKVRRSASLARTRLTDQSHRIQNTSTHKIITTQYRKDGVDPENVKDDQVFYLAKTEYKPFGEQEWKAINDGKLSL